MKSLFVKYKSVIKFILTFLLVYIALSYAYKLYLDNSNSPVYYPDYVTHQVAKQTNALVSFFGYDSQVVKHPDEPSMKMIINGNYLARVIEGCNALSVIILFVAFIVAFKGKLKTTVLYILFGILIIYIINIIRIALLSIGIYHYPEYTTILHSVIFPTIIYGLVFLLWMLWVNKFSNIGKNNG
ncbi:exosortase family protein XrtF [Lacinutrix sp. MedPE-SW]|uniref:exosortase family protein XrtF n=1 Tax=Lacinutrix sp. MedPE-SW TaxID=1860087 RepID=UPI000914FCF1|nr:exosortase family protein XrtF [Lacinutrix sp. MedPE-SW]OIQ21952.1 MAG: exosortase family protein XrtF [Lacinutrix sp. MedPE-SW]